MSQTRPAFILFASLLLALRLSAQVIVPTPAHEYLFNGNLNDTQGGAALVSQGGTVGAHTYTFGVNQGLLLADPLLNATTYTIELSFSFELLSGYRKIVDFKNRTTDTGLYNLNNRLNFYNFTTSVSTDFAANTPVHVVLTRVGESGLVTGYINGVPVLAFTDSGGSAVFNTAGQPLHFFADDSATSGEAASGSVNLIRVFNQTLSHAQVLQLYQAGPTVVPEPSTFALLGLGLLALLVRRRSAA